MTWYTYRNAVEACGPDVGEAMGALVYYLLFITLALLKFTPLDQSLTAFSRCYNRSSLIFSPFLLSSLLSRLFSSLLFSLLSRREEKRREETRREEKRREEKRRGEKRRAVVATALLFSSLLSSSLLFSSPLVSSLLFSSLLPLLVLGSLCSLGKECPAAGLLKVVSHLGNTGKRERVKKTSPLFSSLLLCLLSRREEKRRGEERSKEKSGCSNRSSLLFSSLLSWLLFSSLLFSSLLFSSLLFSSVPQALPTNTNDYHYYLLYDTGGFFRDGRQH
jgi:hypothetical protein